MSSRDEVPRSRVRDPLATPEAIGAEPPPFPKPTSEEPLESAFGDWQRRLTSNLSRRSDGRWDPLTWIHGKEPGTGQAATLPHANSHSDNEARAEPPEMSGTMHSSSAVTPSSRTV